MADDDDSLGQPQDYVQPPAASPKRSPAAPPARATPRPGTASSLRSTPTAGNAPTAGYAPQVPARSKPGYVRAPTPEEMPCAQCGSSLFAWGDVSAQYEIKFQEDGGFMDRTFGDKYKREVRGRMCQTCGNLQLFVR